MKKILKLTSIVSLGSLLLIGCSEKQESKNTAEGALKETSQSLSSLASNVEAAASDIWGKTKDYSEKAKEELIKATESTSNEIDKQLAALKTGASLLGGDAKKQFDASLKEVEAAKNKLNEQIKKIGSATSENWDQVRNDVKSAWDDLKNAFNNLKDKR